MHTAPDVPMLPLDDLEACLWRPAHRSRLADAKTGTTFELMCAKKRPHLDGHRLEWVEVGPRIAPVETGEYL